jgi:hypothetical protein
MNLSHHTSSNQSKSFYIDEKIEKETNDLIHNIQ